MTEVEKYIKDILCLQLKKPKNWNWEISTSKSSPHIALPTIQLYNCKGKLLVETKDHGSTDRQSWKSSQNEVRKDNGRSKSLHLQRSRSDNMEKKLASYRSSSSTSGIVRTKPVPKESKNIQRCKSDTVAVQSLSKKRGDFPSESKNKHIYGDKRQVDTQGNYNKSGDDLKEDNKHNRKTAETHNLRKSKSDIFDIKVKSVFLHTLSEAESIKPYHHRSRSDELFLKTRKKFDIKESRKRAESDGYMKFINTKSSIKINSSDSKNREEENDKEKNNKKRLASCLASAEAVVCSNNPISIEVKDVIKPKRYRLRQSRAGILVISDESFSSTHRRRCHGDFGDCRQDSNDIIIEGDLPNSQDNLHLFKNGFTTKRHAMPPKPDHRRETNLFYSKSNVFPFEQIFGTGPTNSTKQRDTKFSAEIDNNSNYIVNEPLTTPNSDNNKNVCEATAKKTSSASGRKRTKVRRCHSDESTSSSLTEGSKGPLIRNQNTSKTGECDLLQLVRRLSTTKVDEDPLSNQRFQTHRFTTFKSNELPIKKASEGQDIVREGDKGDGCHVKSVMGANVSRHSTKGLSGRSQSSGSICNGKGRHQGDGSGKGSGGSLPSYLDEGGSTSTNNYEDDDEKAQLDEGERIPPLGDGAPLHWKFSDTQTAQCQDQGYGSERSPEEEYPPPLPEHDLEQCHHHLEAHSCYPFITPESTFTVKLSKGSRGLGLSVTGGIESGGSWPGLVRIKRLFPHQPASACGLLNVGDLLLEANGVPLTGLTNYEALEVLRTAANQVELKVSRPPPDVLNCVSPISEVPPPPPARREPPNSLNLTSSYYGSTPEDEYYHGEFEVTLTKIQGSLGFTLRKEDDSALGHYVRALVREPALTDGRIKAGDKIIAVNDVEIFSMTHEQAVQFLRQCGDKVKLRLYRDSPQTPVAALSPTETTPRTSFSRKANLRQEAVDMLNDIAVRKLIPGNQQVTRRSLSPTASPRRLRRQNYPSDASQDSGTKYLIPEEQFHEGMLKCKHFDEDTFNSLFTIENDDMDRPARPNSLDLYNPNQTPVAARKPRFNFSLAHNAYELNNLDPEVLDAPNLTYNLGNEEGVINEAEGGDNYSKEPASMPHIPLDNYSMNFSHKNPAYQSAHPPCVDTDGRSSSSASKSNQHTHKEEETDTIKRKKGILKKDPNKRLDKIETKTEIAKMIPMKEEIEILAIELNRGWNSRLGFSLQGAAGVTYVSAVYADSVAAKDGRIKPGDRIIKVNDQEVEHMSTNEIIDLLRIVRGPVCIFVKRIKSNEDCPKSNAEN